MAQRCHTIWYHLFVSSVCIWSIQHALAVLLHAKYFQLSWSAPKQVDSQLMTSVGLIYQTLETVHVKMNVKVFTHVHAHTCTLCRAFSDAMRWEEHSVARVYLMGKAWEAKREQMGWGRRGTGNEGVQGGKEERASTVRDHHHCCPHQNTLTTTLPPSSPPTIPSHHLQHSDSRL